MTEKLQAWVIKSNQHWERLIERVEKVPSRKTLRQIAFALLERVQRKRPDELDYICDTLKRLVEYFGSNGDSPFSVPSVDDKNCIDELMKRQHATQAYLTLGIFCDIALKANTDARREAGEKLLTNLLQVPTSKIVLCEIGENRTRTNKDLIPVLGVSESRVSQILRPLRNVGLIDFRKDGTSRHYALTEMGLDEVQRVLGKDFRTGTKVSKHDRPTENFAGVAAQFLLEQKKGLGDDEAKEVITSEIDEAVFA